MLSVAYLKFSVIVSPNLCSVKWVLINGGACRCAGECASRLSVMVYTVSIAQSISNALVHCVLVNSGARKSIRTQSGEMFGLQPPRWNKLGLWQSQGVRFSMQTRTCFKCHGCSKKHEWLKDPVFINFFEVYNWVWWYLTLISTLEKQKQVHRCEFEVSLNYIVGSRITKAVSKTKLD